MGQIKAKIIDIKADALVAIVKTWADDNKLEINIDKAKYSLRDYIRVIVSEME